MTENTCRSVLKNSQAHLGQHYCFPTMVSSWSQHCNHITPSLSERERERETTLKFLQISCTHTNKQQLPCCITAMKPACKNEGNNQASIPLWFWCCSLGGRDSIAPEITRSKHSPNRQERTASKNNSSESPSTQAILPGSSWTTAGKRHK